MCSYRRPLSGRLGRFILRGVFWSSRLVFLAIMGLIELMLRRTAVLASCLAAMVATSAAGQVLPVPKDDSGSALSRFRAESLRGAQGALAEFTAAWTRDDSTAAAALFTQSGPLLLPGQATPLSGPRAVEQALSKHLQEAGPLAVSLEDADVGGRLVYISGRFYQERRIGTPDTASSPTVGSYMAVLEQHGRGWKIRALFFLAEPSRSGPAEDGAETDQ